MMKKLLLIFTWTCLFWTETIGGPVEKRNAPQEVSTEITEQQSQEVTNYLKQYYQLVGEAKNPDEVSSDGNGNSTEDTDITETPGYVERVMDVQEMYGLEQTGKANKDLVEAITNSETARCGISDPPSDPNGPGKFTVKAVWDSKFVPQFKLYSLTFSFVEKENIPAPLTYESVEEGILSAMCLWESSSNLRFRHVGDENLLADIKISFQAADHGDFYNFDGTGGTLAHAFYPENGRLHFDVAESWYLAIKGQGRNRYKKDIFTVAAHELGHSIGLMHSKKSGSLMAPIYKFVSTFEEYELPEDDIAGVIDMYGPRSGTDPVEEEGTACRRLYKKYSITGKGVKAVEGKEPVRRAPLIIPCTDDARYSGTRGHCKKWKAAGYCGHKFFAKTMHRKCKETCGFCPKPIPEEKPTGDSDKLVSSVCGIEKFDSVAVVLDSRSFVEMYLFKDDYYFESSLKLESNLNDTYTLLNDTDSLAGVIDWGMDPKSISAGTYDYKQPDFLENTNAVNALLSTKLWYLTFEEGKVHQYSSGTPTLPYIKAYNLDELFPEYPHEVVDAAYVEYNVGASNGTIYSLFRKNKIWQYQEEVTVTETLSKQHLKFVPVASKMGVNIDEWHGVPACDIDAVFKYNDIPYFLKGNTFWPATAEVEPIPRDITYNFLRCWKQPPVIRDIPSQCDALSAGQTDGGNGASGIKYSHLSMAITILIFPLLFS